MKKFLLIGALLASSLHLNASIMRFNLVSQKDGDYYFWDSDLSVKNGKPNYREIIKKHKLVPIDDSIGYSIIDMAVKEFECGGKEGVKCNYELIKDYVNTYNKNVKKVKKMRNKVMGLSAE